MISREKPNEYFHIQYLLKLILANHLELKFLKHENLEVWNYYI